MVEESSASTVLSRSRSFQVVPGRSRSFQVVPGRSRSFQVVRRRAIQRPRRRHPVLGKGGAQPPVPDRVRIGPRVARHTTTETHRVELVCLGPQTHRDSAQTGQTGSIGPRRQRHTPVWGAARERFDCVIALIRIDPTMEARPRSMIHDVRKNTFARRHCPSPFFSD